MTDDGIVVLCGGANNVEDKKLKGHIGQCKSIQKLVIYGTNITHNGVQVALRNLSDLKTIESEYVFQAMTEMQNNQYPASKYALTALIYGSPHGNCFLPGPPFINGTLRLAASLCPLVTKVVLSIDERNPFINEELLALLSLERLCELDITYEVPTDLPKNFHFTFDCAIAPLLKAGRNSLHTLKLSGNAIEVNLDFLIELCPNLQNLHIKCRCTSIRRDKPPTHKRRKNNFVFNQLKELAIGDLMFGFPLSSENLIFLLSAAPSLTYLYIGNCPSLTDQVLQEIYQLHSFRSLRKFELNCCSSVTKKGIDLFMNEGNFLEEIEIFWCESITEMNVEQWRKNTKENNWNLTIKLF